MSTFAADKAVPNPGSNNSGDFWEAFTNKGGNYGPNTRSDALSPADVGAIRSEMRKTLPEYM
eukprot:scaffold477707_cov50-Prasinocladus_malaysianus.AAC.1